MAWGGLKQAIASDPAGVATVLAVADSIPQTAERKAKPVSIRDELAWAIEMESGWRPSATNPTTKATGLLQFMPATAKTMGTTVDDLRVMSLSQQSLYVKRFFKMALAGGGVARVGDIILLMFMPADLHDGDYSVLFARDTAGWRQNPTYRDGKNGPITAGSVRAKGTPPPGIPDLSKLPLPGTGPGPGGRNDTPPPGPPAPPSGSGAGLGLLAVLLALGWSLK